MSDYTCAELEAAFMKIHEWVKQGKIESIHPFRWVREELVAGHHDTSPIGEFKCIWHRGYYIASYRPEAVSKINLRAQSTPEMLMQLAAQLDEPPRPAGLPWCHPDLSGWSIIGMSHHEVQSGRQLFVALTDGDGQCIKAEGADTMDLWTELRRQAREIAGDGHSRVRHD